MVTGCPMCLKQYRKPNGWDKGYSEGLEHRHMPLWWHLSKHGSSICGFCAVSDNRVSSYSAVGLFGRKHTQKKQLFFQ